MAANCNYEDCRLLYNEMKSHYIYNTMNYTVTIRHATIAVFKCPVFSLLRNVIYTTFTLFFKDQALLQNEELVASDEQVQGPHSV